MNQKRLDSLIKISIKREACMKIDYGEMIEEFY